MKNFLYVIAVILVLGWIAGLMLKIAGGLIHLLLVIAVIAILINIIQGRKPL
ncbi:MAG TPA: lmo0937 family membrane protein [Bacteroidia bacterium]|nr:lmo0937 family membrane protein [Bacteroidia bacterium]